MDFASEIADAMGRLAERSDTVFVGQSLRYDGSSIHASMAKVPMSRRIEMPVIEDFQLGYCTGLAMGGKLPICIYPRLDFLMLAMNQLVLHLDKLPEMSPWSPKVIIRAPVGRKSPLNAGPQHTGDYASALELMLHHVTVWTVESAEQVKPVYDIATKAEGSQLIIEYPA